VQFRGLPQELREFPIIWAIGSILGVSRAVDTKFTKKHGRARMKVAVLNPDLIPDFLDVVIGDFVYELQFRVESEITDGEPQVIDMDSTIDDDEAPKEKEPENMDLDGNKIDESPVDQAQDKKSVTPEVPRGQLKQAAAGIPTNSVSSKDIAGDDTQIDSREKKNCDKPMVLLKQTGMTQDGTAQWKATMGDSILPNKTKALNSGGVSPVRASKWNASTSEQDSLEKATKLKARKNMDTPSLKGNENQP